MTDWRKWILCGKWERHYCSSILCYYPEKLKMLVWYHRPHFGDWQGKIPVLRILLVNRVLRCQGLL